MDGVRAHMDRHRAILAPKFERVIDPPGALGGPGGRSGRARRAATSSAWTCSTAAARVVELAKEAGVELTPAGAAYPYGKDPRDRNIRIAPTFPSSDEVEAAIDGLATCVLIAATEHLLAG